MRSKAKLLKNCRLYFILDREVAKNPLYLLKKLSKAKIDIIQFRDKSSSKQKILSQARKIKRLLAKKPPLLIINDHPDIAMRIDADGVHLGQDNLPLPLARRLLGEQKIIGISCHNLKQALEAQRSGADYISIGPVFKTPLKPDTLPLGAGTLKKISKKIKIPYFAVGGIDLDNLNRVSAAKTKAIAVCRMLSKGNSQNRIIDRLRQSLA